jgi:integrase
MNQDIAPSTISQYATKSQWLNNRYLKYKSDTQKGLVQWVGEVTSKIGMRAWTSYRAALIWGLNNNEILLDGTNKEKQVAILTNPKNVRCIKKRDSTKTTRLRYKNIPEQIYKKLQMLMNGSSSNYDTYLKYCFEATIMTGLRPSEWKTLEIGKIKDKDGNSAHLLRVKNGKASQGRSFGMYRNLLVKASSTDMDIIIKVNEMAKTIYQKGGLKAWDKFNTSCIDRLKYLNTRIGQTGKKKRVTLYSARHQFKINMEAREGCDRYILAALMGHGSIATAGINYGRKGKAIKSRIKIIPHKIDVNKVKQLNEGKNYKLEFDNSVKNKTQHRHVNK